MNIDIPISCMHVDMLLCKQACINVYVHMCLCIFMHVGMCVAGHAWVSYIFTYIYVCIYTERHA